MTSLTENIIFFDDDCLLCNASVRFIAKRDAGLFRFASLKDFSKITHKINNNDEVILTQQKGIYRGAKAIKQICKNLKGMKWAFYLLSLLPDFLLNWGYAFIARNRHLISKKDKAPCVLDKQLQQRIIN